ncbi:hypothetical protein [Lutispora saccharofermentans]|uniref:DUF2680 domain-containing protein n=1 Tax=Lutispora saccharofermentans TaxID=3024236 RepID=A0ABT1NE89_9FIRM|nr:hypothetical protein [Lutispora saccharofermentans]MCQ1529583.1 hypothetical protein [Lutispora saccharofermentans]
MKRTLLIITIVSILAIALSSIVLAAEDKTPQWFKDMMDWRADQIDQAQKDGAISQKEAEGYKQGLEQMKKWHEENGFGYGMMGRGGCHGSGMPYWNSPSNN